jgi:uncharacterized protein
VSDNGRVSQGDPSSPEAPTSSAPGPQVVALSSTAIKGTRLRSVESIVLEHGGARGDRRFFVIDGRGRMVNGKVFGQLQAVVPDWDDASRRLALTFPDGELVEDVVGSTGALIETQFFSRVAPARLIDGPWSAALSAFLGSDVRIVEIVPGEERRSGVDRADAGAASLISSGSLRRLAAEGSLDRIDARRFRMLIEVDGVEPHAEDAWVGREVSIGAAVIRFAGHVGRCMVTSRDPETGETDLPTLDLLGAYRRGLRSTEPLPFGIYGSVVRAGPVSLGDPVTVAGVPGAVGGEPRAAGG